MRMSHRTVTTLILVVDQDAIPQRKVQVDNKVRCHVSGQPAQPSLLYTGRSHSLKLDQSLPCTALTVSFPETIDVDVDDDLGHELAL